MSIGLRRSVLFTSDASAMLFSAFITYAVTIGTWSLYHDSDLVRLISVQLVLSVICLLYFAHKGHYTWRNPWWQQVRQSIRTCFLLGIISLLINLLTLPDVSGYQWIAIYWTISAILLLSFRWIGRAVLKSLNHWDIPTVLVGGVDNIIETIFALRSEVYLTYDIKKVVLTEPDPQSADKLKIIHGNLNIQHDMGDIPTYSMVIICPNEYSSELVADCIDKISQVGARFAIVPPTKGFSLYGLQPQFFFGHKIVLLEMRSHFKTNWGRATKFVLDKIGALVGLILLAPVFIILALKIRKDGGSPFYAQTRIGKNGKKFKCWKFRSMIVNADKILGDYLEQNPEAKAEYERDFKLKDDPRITPIGHFIRRTSLDEIPQFFNVLKGDMSLVGPRPIVDGEVAYYGDKFSYYTSGRPGITGMWQVSGRNDVSYEQRVAFDVWYVEHWSIWNDIVIILKTIAVILLRKGAY